MDDQATELAGRLAAARTPFDAYLVLSDIADEELAAVANRLEKGTRAHLLAYCAARQGIRAVGFLAIEDHQSDTPALRWLLDSSYDRLMDGEADAATAAARMVVESCVMVDTLSADTRIAALELGLRLCELHPQADFFVAALRLAGGSEDTYRLAYRLSLTASLCAARYEATGDLADLEEAIAVGERALTSTTEGSYEEAVIRMNQANVLRLWFDAGGELADLERAIGLGAETLACGLVDGEERAGALDQQATRLRLRYEATGSRDDLDQAIALGAEALILAPKSGRERAGYLSNQANRLNNRWDVTEDQADLEKAIALGSEALALAPRAGPARASVTAGLANRHQRRYEVMGDVAELEEAIEMGADAIAHSPERGPTRAQYLNGQANRLRLRYENAGDHADLKEAIRLGAEALEHAPGAGSGRARFLSSQANRLESLFKVTGQPGDLDTAIALGAAALENAAGSPYEASGTCDQTARLRLRHRLMGHRSDLQTIVELTRRWADIVEGEGGTRHGIIDNARWWMLHLCELAGKGLVPWELVARVARSLLSRAARFANLPEPGPVRSDLERDAHAVGVRFAVDGVMGVAALAHVRSGDVAGAIEVLEEGAATIARDQASRIPWDLACRQVPGLAKRALKFQAAIGDATATGATEGLGDLHNHYAATVDALRVKLEIPTVAPKGLEELARRAVGALVWVVATPVGGVALRLDPGGEAHHLELEDFSLQTATTWHARLHPAAPSGRRATPARRGNYVPHPDQVAAVVAEMVVALGAVGAWLKAPETVLVPVGLLGSLPWQSVYPRLRLHVSATAATFEPQLRSAGDLVLYADAGKGGPLPGARAEAVALAGDYPPANLFVGTAATLESLARLHACRILHLALHGTPEPALLFADENLNLATVHRLRHLWRSAELVFLNCCTSAATLEGVKDETLGVATIALTGGASCVVVALWPIDDDGARLFATAYHRHRHHGADPHEALSRGRDQILASHPATAHAYQVLG